MKHSRMSTVGMGSLFASLAVAAAVVSSAGDAKAAIFNDSFNGQGNPNTAWSFWSSTASSDAQVVASPTYAHSAPNMLYINLGYNTTSSDWNLAYRTFTAPGTAPVKSCSVFAEVRAWYTEKVQLQMVNPNDWTYIAIGDMNFTNPSCTNPEPATCYGHGQVNNTWPCSNTIQVRLVLTGGNGGSRLVYLDDVAVTFNQ